ncbi:YggT family protein [Novosphingobium ginsenosidimutans]|uniref:YggT family protein n=1 Tax=Novosphingobium ginsenosidimutans TaxID=1176536 RepID=A0A5B8S1N0_9SPHN|nr:YggT family protein [Novosphingobium ginsenosidimutans]QEA15416.1 YggT family protein [Novosphingobium ginsenosidimutans]
MINEVLVPILVLFANVITTAVIVQFILGLLISFNVVNYHNQLVSALWTALNAILDPILAPIKRRMPNTGGIDFSPIVLLLLIQVAIIILSYVGRQVG